ncbi:aldo/keto reductase [Pontiella agarivorans]|uniref:Aldo/keto reductase n=1 Tax=Pontiella agarivorans TaxID=3038953 RepID=A0ABU5MTB8_9BACT|nr:aldo/keto reductase [Pontiella agarivorans]MDZ8117358.1 aldo/keto reductase [Pontiella agarivorans]
MSYRVLGRTGFMVSEIVLGTFPFTSPDSDPLFDRSLERGINYFDCASAYSQGGVEENLGRYFKQSGNRERLFLSTKLSAYYGMVEQCVQEILKGLPAARQKELRKKAQDLLERRTVKRPGYHINYFGGQEKQFDKAYLRYVVLKEYGMTDAWRARIKANAHKLLEESLQRLQTDYVDVLFLPHGSALPELMDDIVEELFSEFKKKGLIRASAVSFHNDVTNNLLNASQVGFYDVAMCAYNIANHAALDPAMYKARQSGMGLIAMKVAKLFSMQNQPPWRAGKLNATLPDENLSIFAKSYLWALQNPNLSCCVSQMETAAELNDNLQVVGRKVPLKAV